MKFIHLADLHLGRAFEGLTYIPNAISKKLHEINDHFFEDIVTFTIEEQMDFLLLAGDTFHLEHPTVQLQAKFMKQLNRLDEAGIPVFLHFGNHDFNLSQGWLFSFPDNVYLFEHEEVKTYKIYLKNQRSLAVSSFSYTQRWLSDSMLSSFPKRDTTVDFHIGMYHGEQYKTEGTDQQYAPFFLSEMKKKGYDYWALGHIHQAKIVQAKPWITYSGTPLGRTQKETGEKGFFVVEDQQGSLVPTFHPANKVQWEKITLSFAECGTLEKCIEKLENQFTDRNSSIDLWLYKITFIYEEALFLNNPLLQVEELNEYITEYFLEKYANTLWIYQVIWQKSKKKIEGSLQVSDELIESLVKIYLDEPIFIDQIPEILSSPKLTSLLKLDEQKRKEILLRAKEKIEE